MDLYLQYIFVLCQSRGWRKQRKKMRRWAKNSAHLEIVMCDVWQPEITTVELDGRALWSTVSYVFASMKKNVISWCTTWRICLVRKLFIDCYRARKNLVYIQYIYICVCVCLCTSAAQTPKLSPQLYTLYVCVYAYCSLINLDLAIWHWITMVHTHWKQEPLLHFAVVPFVHGFRHCLDDASAWHGLALFPLL